jgi:hypothetical protein
MEGYIIAFLAGAVLMAVFVFASRSTPYDRY